MKEPGAEAAREHLTKVLASEEFHNSERLCRFLRFIVEAKLRGEQDQVKEYLIGKEVFDRDGEYDPRLDPIVRVEARRLRKKLEEFYARPGSGDGIRIQLPKGAYVPEIHETIPEPAHSGQTWFTAWWKWAVPLVIMLALPIAYFWPKTATAETVAVIPARWVWTGNDFPDIRHDEDLAERIAANLISRHQVNVVAWPSIQKFRESGRTTRQMADELGASRLIIVAVRVEADGFRVTAYTIDPKLDRKLNVSDSRNVALDTPADRERAAARIASQ